MNSVFLAPWVSLSCRGTSPEYLMMLIFEDRGLGLFIWLCLFLEEVGIEILEMVIKQMITDTEHKEKMEMAKIRRSK